jgi:hypothetical protein
VAGAGAVWKLFFIFFVVRTSAMMGREAFNVLAIRMQSAKTIGFVDSSPPFRLPPFDLYFPTLIEYKLPNKVGLILATQLTKRDT